MWYRNVCGRNMSHYLPCNATALFPKEPNRVPRWQPKSFLLYI